jgi:16S rRNA (guanine527-N7)-methyltransferase
LRIIDLGSGGGVPALVIAMELGADANLWLVESVQRRANFLIEAVEALGVRDRVTVVPERAEEVGRRDALRGAFDAVTARAFGRPSVAAECAAPFLRVGGTLVVSEPPPGVEGLSDQAEDRWPDGGLSAFGLELAERAALGGYSFALLRQVATCPPWFPRRSGLPRKRPLF